MSVLVFCMQSNEFWFVWEQKGVLEGDDCFLRSPGCSPRSYIPGCLSPLLSSCLAHVQLSVCQQLEGSSSNAVTQLVSAQPVSLQRTIPSPAQNFAFFCAKFHRVLLHFSCVSRSLEGTVCPLGYCHLQQLFCCFLQVTDKGSIRGSCSTPLVIGLQLEHVVVEMLTHGLIEHLVGR